MQIHIECEYCGSVYDYSENHSCPNCAGVPSKKRITAAKAEAKAEAAEAHIAPAPVPAGRVMKVLIKLIPVWIVCIFVMLFIPDIKEHMAENTIREHLQTVDTPEFREHGLNEEFLYDGIMNVSVDDAYFANSSTADALIPENMKMLVVHISASVVDGADQRNMGNYYDNEPYIAFGKTFRRPLSYTALIVFPEIYSRNMFYFSSMRYYDSREGYFCFLVDKDAEEFALCLEETHTEGYVRQLDCVHRINFSITEEAEQ